MSTVTMPAHIEKLALALAVVDRVTDGDYTATITADPAPKSALWITVECASDVVARALGVALWENGYSMATMEQDYNMLGLPLEAVA